MTKKATIIKYYQVVDETGMTIEDAHTYQQALAIKRDWEKPFKPTIIHHLMKQHSTSCGRRPTNTINVTVVWNLVTCKHCLKNNIVKQEEKNGTRRTK